MRDGEKRGCGKRIMGVWGLVMGGYWWEKGGKGMWGWELREGLVGFKRG